ncbi:hypothetical protein F0P96_04770 [Hymenobacter busanensis]|uniref:Uncharacterized protein n=1 Tax=Hymenobacter busanensis TaxID=2607656 RepID=A0A7L5A1R0_9BACT|nr:hypothetical protein [Hymenobacter busanensis]KAA9338164.1 hypothetical protein F0P96_04770 [Hymenobacter busanensis]QHJ09411.1 hypothetical protein GUY19_19840 [Hymenobacter busanensis]
MLLLRFFLRRASLLLALTSSLALSGCGNGFFPDMDDEELPHYTLSAQEQAWVTPYRLGEEWRFRNAAGYERRYQVRGLTDRTWPGHPAGSSMMQYYQQEVGARVERVDSAYDQRADQYKFAATMVVGAAIKFEAQPLPLMARFEWGSTALALPVAEVNSMRPLPAGVRLLPAATFGSQTYQNVLEYTNLQPRADQPLAPWVTTRLYYSREQGVVRFVEADGTVWDRA